GPQRSLTGRIFTWRRSECVRKGPILAPGRQTPTSKAPLTFCSGRPASSDFLLHQPPSGCQASIKQQLLPHELGESSFTESGGEAIPELGTMNYQIQLKDFV